MQKPNRTLRRAVQIAVWTLLMLALLGPHSAWSICLTGDCTEPNAVSSKATATAPSEVGTASCCSCCNDDDADSSRGQGDGENGGETCPGCCIDLAIAIDEAPMPQPVRAPDSQQQIVAILPDAALHVSSAVAARFARPDTGPPRTDQRTELIATTILRE